MTKKAGPFFTQLVKKGPAFFLLLAAAGCHKTAVAEDDGAAPPISVQTEVVRLETLRLAVSGPGVITPASAADWIIVAPEMGRIAELPKAEGDQVKPDDVLVRFDFANLTSEVHAREAEVATAVTRLEAAKGRLARVSAMFDRGYTSRNEFDAAKSAVAAADLDVSRSKMQLDAATQANDRATVKARFSGVVTKRFHNAGDLVNGTSADPVLRVIDPTHLQVAMTVLVQDLPKLQPGQPATIVSANGPEPGTVVLRPLPEDPHATTQEIRLAFTNPTTLSVDAPVQVEILLAERANVAAVPAAAVLRGNDGRAFIMVAGVDGRAHRRDVHVGLATRDRVEIIAGVTPGDRVIVRDAAQVPEGALLSEGR